MYISHQKLISLINALATMFVCSKGQIPDTHPSWVLASYVDCIKEPHHVWFLFSYQKKLVVRLHWDWIQLYIYIDFYYIFLAQMKRIHCVLKQHSKPPKGDGGGGGVWAASPNSIILHRMKLNVCILKWTRWPIFIHQPKLLYLNFCVCRVKAYGGGVPNIIRGLGWGW